MEMILQLIFAAELEADRESPCGYVLEYATAVLKSDTETEGNITKDIFRYSRSAAALFMRGSVKINPIELL
jgi:hypothetical protein